MADPLSATGTLVGLLSLGIQISESLVKYYGSYKDQDKTVKQISNSLDGLISTLRALRSALTSRKFRSDEQDLIKSLASSIDGCDEIVSELQEECDKILKTSANDFKSSLQKVGRRLIYPLRESTLKKLEEDIQTLQNNLGLAINVLVLGDQQQTHDDTATIKKLTEALQAAQISTEIKNWLRAPDATINHHAACAKKHNTTGSWFTNDDRFNDWLQEPNDLLWINGFAGCGKSVLCSTAIQATLRHREGKLGCGIAFFYFDFTDSNKQGVSGMLRALLQQLGGQSSDANQELAALHVQHKDGTIPDAALIACLERVVRQLNCVYIILDALDEVPRGSSRKVVLEAIKTMRSWNSANLSLMVTSRDEADIRDSLCVCSPTEITLRNNEIDKDINDFITDHLEMDPKLRKWHAHHDRIRKVLSQKAQGMFRWAECQLEAIKRCPRSVRRLEQCLQSLPEDLDETYQRILCAIPPESGRDALRILTMLCFSVRALTVSELVDALAVDLKEPPCLDRGLRLEDAESLLEICPGLIEIYQSDRHQCVRIAHFSVQEYLQSSRIKTQRSRSYAMDITAAHAEIAEVCLVYLFSPEMSRSTVSRFIYGDLPLCDYAANAWFLHYAYQKDTSQKLDAYVFRLFTSSPRTLKSWFCLYQSETPARYYDESAQDAAMPLYYASLLGLQRVLAEIPHAADDVNRIGGPLGTALGAASFYGHLDVVRLLLDWGTNVDECSPFSGTPLQIASRRGELQVVQLLLDRGADLNLAYSIYGTALIEASMGGHLNTIKLLLARGADVNKISWDHGGPLHVALRRGNLELMQLFLDSGADINAPGGLRHIPLHEATTRGETKTLRFLLDRGANANILHEHWGTALTMAASDKNLEKMQMLLEAGTDINISAGYCGTALQAAVLQNHDEGIHLLFKWAADVNVQGGKYGTALQAASYYGNLDLMRTLIDRGADVNLVGGRYGTALHAAIASKKLQRVEFLLEQPRINVNLSDKKWGTPLQAASFAGSLTSVQLLLDHGADMNLVGGESDSALNLAVQQNHLEVVKLLLANGADVHICGKDGSPLEAAMRGNLSAIEQILIEHGARSEAVDTNKLSQ